MRIHPQIVIFIVAAVAFVIVVVYFHRWNARRANNRLAMASSSDASRQLLLLGVCFTLIGVAILYFLCMKPFYLALSARQWPTTIGTVLSSTVELHSGKHTSYSIEIRYRYSVHDAVFIGTRYDASPGASSGYDWRQAIVDGLPAGAKVNVHYDPAFPKNSLLNTDVPGQAILLGLIGLVFAVPGVGCVLLARSVRAGRVGVGAGDIAATRNISFNKRADSRTSRRRSFIVLLIVTFVWNGVTFIPIFGALGGRSDAGMGYGCLAPFILVGLLMMGATIRGGLALFNPSVTVTFSRMPVAAGGRLEAVYDLGGNVLAIRLLEFHLEAREQVIVQRADRTRSETTVIRRIPVMQTTQKGSMLRGRFVVDIPRDALSISKSSYSRVAWYLRCRGEILHRPDINDDFAIDVVAEIAPETAEGAVQAGGPLL